MPRTKGFEIVELESFAKPKAPRKLSPRQIASLERDNRFIRAMNHAATLPRSQAVSIDITDEKLPTIRAAMTRLLTAEPRDMQWGIRGNKLVFSKSPIPGGRGKRRTSSPKS